MKKKIPDSPKFRNKNQVNVRNVRTINQSTKKSAILPKTKSKSIAHDIVVVRGANKKSGIEKDPDIQRLQVIIKFIHYLFHSDSNIHAPVTYMRCKL